MEDTKMKKIISLLTAATMLLSAAPLALAANADDMQQTLISVKSRITVPEELDKFESYEYTDDGETEYNFTWRTEDYKKSINVSCSADGIITSYNVYEGYNRHEPSISGMSSEEAKSIAEAFVRDINPDYPYSTVVEDASSLSLYTSDRNFPITIYVNGVKLAGENGYVSVDAETGKVSRFNIWYMSGAEPLFTSADEFVSQSDAMSAYSENFPPELVYRSYYDDDSNEIHYPAYIQTDKYNEYIDALTGEKITLAANLYSLRNSAAKATFAIAEDADAGSGGGLSPQEIAEIDKINGLISKADIEKQLRKNKILSIPSDVKVSSMRLYKEWRGDDYMYQIAFSSDNEDNYTSINLTANAKTGEVMFLSRYSSGQDKTEPKQNDKVFKSLAGSKSSEYSYDEESMQYSRYVNGIKVESDTAYMSFDGDTLTYYNINYSDTEFPSLEGVMSAEDAAWAIFNGTDYEAVCKVGYDEDGNVGIYPVYDMADITVNPFTGSKINWRNEEITEDENAPITYSDISGHYAENCIKELAKYDIGFEGGEFKPDAKITQADLLILLETITNGHAVIIAPLNYKEVADTAYLSAIQSKIISEDERDDSAVITRETASVYLIRAIGAEEYAKYNDIYIAPFSDVTANKGYISLLTAMGVVSGDSSGKFNPSQEITRAEFAVMLYKYLSK